MTLTRLVQMSPAELSTRARQACQKRWGKPPACETVACSSARSFPDPPCPQGDPEKICQHRFDLLGYTDLDFGTPIDWHFDPVHGRRAPRKPWHQIPFLDFDLVGDHKIIWELNRHQHLVTLAQDGHFRAEILDQWTHWQRENPYPIGINWASALEVAFRALSWLWVRHFVGDFHADLIPALHLHGWYIEHFLSTYFSPNTHLLGEGVALFAIGLLCPQISEAPRWQHQGWQIVLQQAETQVRPDGFHFEQSVYYHQYALDFFRFARELAARNAIAIPPSFDRTIEKMTDASGLPNFGDDDGGHVVVSPRPRVCASPPGSVGGIYSMASCDTRLFIDAGPQGAFAAGHGHADALSIQLISHGRPILIDPGTYCYVCPERDRFRGTAAHNTLQIDGRDQARSAGPFAWTSLPEITVDRWHTGESLDFFAGHHDGYFPAIHHRWVIGLKSGFWLVRDLVSGTGRHRLDIHWHFLEERDIAILPAAGHTWLRAVERWDWSPVYGKKEPACVLRFSKETELPAEFAVVLTPAEPGAFTQTAPGAYRYEDSQGAHDFVFAAGGLHYRGGAGEITL